MQKAGRRATLALPPLPAWPSRIVAALDAHLTPPLSYADPSPHCHHITCPRHLRSLRRCGHVARPSVPPTRVGAQGERLAKIERDAARERHNEQAKVNFGLSDGGKFPPSEAGKSRDKVGAALGMSGRTYEKGRL